MSRFAARAWFDVIGFRINLLRRGYFAVNRASVMARREARAANEFLTFFVFLVNKRLAAFGAILPHQFIRLLGVFLDVAARRIVRAADEGLPGAGTFDH